MLSVLKIISVCFCLVITTSDFLKHTYFEPHKIAMPPSSPPKLTRSEQLSHAQREEKFKVLCQSLRDSRFALEKETREHAVRNNDLEDFDKESKIFDEQVAEIDKLVNEGGVVEKVLNDLSKDLANIDRIARDLEHTSLIRGTTKPDQHEPMRANEDQPKPYDFSSEDAVMARIEARAAKGSNLFKSQSEKKVAYSNANDKVYDRLVSRERTQKSPLSVGMSKASKDANFKMSSSLNKSSSATAVFKPPSIGQVKSKASSTAAAKRRGNDRDRRLESGLPQGGLARSNSNVEVIDELSIDYDMIFNKSF